MSYVTSWLCTCTNHVIDCYKRSALLAHWALIGSSVRSAYTWCLMRVGRDASCTSLGWSLPPSSIIIVLALVNSAVSPKGTQVSQRDLGVSPHSLSVPLPQDCCAFWLVPMCIMVEATLKCSTWLQPCIFHIQYMTYVKLHLSNVLH